MVNSEINAPLCMYATGRRGIPVYRDDVSKHILISLVGGVKSHRSELYLYIRLGPH